MMVRAIVSAGFRPLVARHFGLMLLIESLIP
jgi:hypothetical protein